MSEKIVRFSRLLRIFELDKNPAYIVELEENNQKTLYISYYKPDEDIQSFESYNKTHLKEEFENLSTHCLMSQCTNATGMFAHSSLTHFEADCSSLIYGRHMFAFSPLCSIKTEFTTLKDGEFMFWNTQLKEINCHFPKIKYKKEMFRNTSPELKQNSPQYFV